MAKVLLKAFGIKRILKLGWSYLIYPKLRDWVESNEYPEWDEKLLKLVNDNFNKVIDLV